MTDDLAESWRDLGFPPEDNGCIQCGKKVNADGSGVTWRCAGCNRLVCRECTLCEPGPSRRAVTASSWLVNWVAQIDDRSFDVPSPGGVKYMEDTLCSLRCWERIGRPEE